jgi:hypothetical protein
MARKYWLDLPPSILLACAIILSSLIAVLAAKSTWLFFLAPALLAVAGGGADALNSFLRGKSSHPSPGALILGATFLLAGSLATLGDPSLVKTLLPIVGACAWVTLLLRPDNRRETCSAN